MNKYLLVYPSEIVEEPLLAKTVLETNVLMNILWADVKYDEGKIVIAVVGDEKDERRVINNLKRKGIKITKLEKKVEKIEDECIDCGACISLCPTEAITVDDFTVNFHSEKCVYCNACVEACPLRAVKIHEVK